MQGIIMRIRKKCARLPSPAATIVHTAKYYAKFIHLWIYSPPPHPPPPINGQTRTFQYRASTIVYPVLSNKTHHVFLCLHCIAIHVLCVPVNLL